MQTQVNRIPTLNEAQRLIFERINDAIQGHVEENVFFAEGTGGAGKTYLYNVILGKHRMDRKVCLAVASSGIAAELLMGGQTPHSRYINNNIQVQNTLGNRFRIFL